MILKGERQLQARLKAIGKTELLMRDIVIHGVMEAKHLHKPNRKTGNLERTIRVGTVTRTSASIKAGGTTKVGYAAALELGTRPHTIRPRKAKVLAWGGPRTLGGRLRVSGGVQARATHFARFVRHPGNKPYPYLRPGLQKAAKEFGIDKIVALWNGAA